MRNVLKFFARDPFLILSIFLLLTISYIVLRSIAPFVFPNNYVYLALGILGFIVFSHIDFEILSLFKWQIYVLCIIFLIIPLIIGQVTRGAVRWIPIGPLSFQPSEIVRPFLLIFFAGFLTDKYPDMKRFVFALVLLFIPLFLILIQPSLGVTMLTFAGFLGVTLASPFSKKSLLLIVILGLSTLPVILFFLAPYQRGRIQTFLDPSHDPTGAGYNSIQSMISVGSGRLTGRGLGEGVQTQLSFLPERHTDFIFASIAEELGFVGAGVLMFASFFLLYRLIQPLYKTKSVAARCFVSGLFLSLFIQTLVNMGMNMGLLPITGVPLPLVSAGGSSLLATMIALGIVMATH